MSLKSFRNKLKYFALGFRRGKIKMCWSLCTSSKMYEFWPWSPSDSVAPVESRRSGQLLVSSLSIWPVIRPAEALLAVGAVGAVLFLRLKDGLHYQGKAPAQGQIKMRKIRKFCWDCKWDRQTQSGVMFHNSLIRVLKRFTNNNHSFKCFIPECNSEEESTLTWLHTAQRNWGTEKLRNWESVESSEVRANVLFWHK